MNWFNINSVSHLFLLWIMLAACQKEDNPKPDDPPELFYTPTPYTLSIPEDFPSMDIPFDNPMTEEGVQLGRMLFYDPILSGDSTLACAGCHKQEFAFTDEQRFSVGIEGERGDRNAMPIINIGWMKDLFWDGRAEGGEAQALGPVENPIEMHETWDNAIEKLKRHPNYPTLFSQAFGTWDFTKEHAAKAIAQFERTLISGNSKYDQVLIGNASASYNEFLGHNIFFSEKGDCFHCHGGILFTDNLFHNNGLDIHPSDPGLEKVTLKSTDSGKFKTPTLRNIALTAPYMHDGRFETLEEVIDFYSEGLQFSENIDPLMKNVHQGGVQLTDDEKYNLIAFLHMLTDTTFLKNEALASPFD